MKILAAGGAGFLGRHLCRKLYEAVPDLELTVLDLPGKKTPEETEFLPCDLTEIADSKDLLRDRFFDVAIQMVGVIKANSSLEYHRLNVETTGNLLENLDPPPGRLILLSSSAVYGAPTPDWWPVNEKCPFDPVSEYGRSSIERETLALELCRRRNVYLAVVRPFNMIGPGQDPVMMVPAFAKKMASMEKMGYPTVMEVGDLDSRRDFIDVRDVADLIAGIVTSDVKERIVYFNAATGTTYPGRWILERLKEKFRLPESFSVKESSFGKGGSVVRDLPGDSSSAKRLLGWNVSIPLEQSLGDISEDWRRRILLNSDP